MMFRKLVGLIHRNHRGFALIELMIAVAIGSLVIGAATMTLSQIFSGSARSSNQMIAVRQVQNAGYWIGYDTQMSQSVVITGISGFPLTLAWTDHWDSDLEHQYQVVYSLEDMSGGLKNLQRSYSIDSGVPTETMVAEFVDPDPTKTNYKFSSGGAFSLPNIDDEFTITGDFGGDSGTVRVAAGSISVTGTGTWDDPDWSTTAGQTIIVTATDVNTSGNWTAATGAATAAITIASNSDATLANGSVLIFTITATVGTGSQETNETRVYEITPRPNF